MTAAELLRPTDARGNIKTTGDIRTKTCVFCHQRRNVDQYLPCKTILCPDGESTVCNMCLEDYLRDKEYSWDAINTICQALNYPFDLDLVDTLRRPDGSIDFISYAAHVQGGKYVRYEWYDYYKQYEKYIDDGSINDHIPKLAEARRSELKARWGENYDDEALQYLENLRTGLLMTQQVNGALQLDQALKICKMSYEIDCRIREGDDFDKLLSSYDKLVKAAEFSPKNAKNAADFDSTGELIRWLEKGGWKNQFYDGATRDVVDETIKNIQAYNQRLYTNESGMGDEITNRIENLKNSQELENNYNLVQLTDIDQYETDGFDELFNEDFKEDLNNEEDN